MRKTMDGTIDEITEKNDKEENKATLIVWFLLQKYLAEAISLSSGDGNESVLQIGKKLDSFSYDKDKKIMKLNVNDVKNGQKLKMTCNLLIGADGIKSKVRDVLDNQSIYKYHNRILYRAILHDHEFNMDIAPIEGYTVVYRCGKPGKVFAFRQLSEHIYSFTASVTVDTPLPDEVKKLTTKKDRLKKYFIDYPDAVQHIISCVSENAIYENEVWDIDFTHKWSKDDIPVILIGDSAHAMTPKLGQGANIALEDATELAHCLGEFLKRDSSDNISKKSLLIAFQDFKNLRVPRVKEVHRASRDALSNTIPADLRNKVYQWNPSFIADNHLNNDF